MFFLLYQKKYYIVFFFFFQAEDGIRDRTVTGVQTCALPIFFFATTVQAGSRAMLDNAPLIRKTRFPRSEERRVGKECRSRWSPDHYKKKRRQFMSCGAWLINSKMVLYDRGDRWMR